MSLTQFLASLKGVAFQSRHAEQLQALLKQKGITELRLWSLRSEARFLFRMARFQVFLLMTIPCIFIPHKIYTQYQANESSIGTLALKGVAVGIGTVGVLILYRKMLGRILDCILYNPETNTFILKKYASSSSLSLKPEEITYNLNKKGMFKEIVTGKQKFKVEGMGIWEGDTIFKHILEQKHL